MLQNYPKNYNPLYPPLPTILCLLKHKNTYEAIKVDDLRVLISIKSTYYALYINL